MARRSFLTVPDELIDCADRISDHFETHGFKLEVEESQLEYPYTPTVSCRREHTTLFVEVDNSANLARLEQWSRYARSCPNDTRIALALPGSQSLTARSERKLNELGIGVYAVFSDRVIERMTPRDQALNAQLPPIKSLGPVLREKLGHVYEQFVKSEWREGFEAACQVLEVEARRHLVSGCNTGRIVLLRPNGKPRQISEADIEAMTMGALAKAFAEIQTKNQADSQIASVLAAINKDRVRVVHHKGKPDTEASLRKNVGQHMWKIISGLKLLLE